jgi:antitoxin (DNA-binding transcriptional repressor) of toxin-antitoxin stability system
METVGVRELKQKTTQVLRRVREKQAQIRVTYRGEIGLRTGDLVTVLQPPIEFAS